MIARRLPLHRKLIYSAIIFFGFFGFLELGLRMIKVGKPPTLGTLRFGYDTGIPLFDSDGIEQEGVVYQDMPLFERHSELLWQPVAGSPFTGPRGLRKPEPEWVSDNDEAFTVLIVGDSCSFLGKAPYPARLTELLQAQSKQRTIRIYNASCPGYSSAQGVLRLHQFQDLRPDLVIVYFGWNDHWRSLNGCTDRELFERNQLIARTQSILSNFHFYWMIYSLAASHSTQPAKPPVTANAEAPVRVPLSDYSDNLKAIVEQAASWNGRALFLTAPTNFERDKMPEWATNFFGQFYQMSPEQVAAIPTLHHQYNQRVREVAQSSTHASVCDLESTLNGNATCFRTDCIHLTEEGHRQVAELVAQRIKAMWP